MFPCHGPLAILAVAGLILCGISWLCWLRQIGLEASKALPGDQRVQWGLTERMPAGRMHLLWQEHEKQFPNSRKRMYAVLSLLFFFLIPIPALIACILLPSTRWNGQRRRGPGVAALARGKWYGTSPQMSLHTAPVGLGKAWVPMHDNKV
jgi:hypothetical protein